jgi:hypothetical protein
VSIEEEEEEEEEDTASIFGSEAFKPTRMCGVMI